MQVSAFLVGDDLYGTASLHAAFIEFVHPVTEKQ